MSLRALVTAPAASVRAAGQISVADPVPFEALECDVCIETESLGDVWLVPARTGRARTEITTKHLALIERVLVAFPGAQLVGLWMPDAFSPRRKEEP